MQYLSQQRDKTPTTTEQEAQKKKNLVSENKYKARKYQESYKISQNTTLGAAYGKRQLKIVSSNIDDLRNKTMLKELDIRMSNMKADLVCLQETHETKSTDQETENYRYISTAAQPTDGATNGKGIGGVASLVKKGWRINIMGIT